MAAFDYELPPERIAQVPVEPRDAARLLVDRGRGHPAEHRRVADLPDLLEPGDVLVVNDTRVIPARLHLVKATGGAAEVLLLEPGPVPGTWEALVRPGRRLPPGTPLHRPGADPDRAADPGSVALVVEDDLGDGRRLVRVSSADASSGAGESGAGQPVPDVTLDLAEEVGELPLPPYITEPLADPDRYQTVYARRPGSAAAPTAGLHLTPEVLDHCRAHGVDVATVELVVGLGTFRPIAVDQVEDHVMHRERYVVDPDVLRRCGDARAAGHRVVAVGTTTVRALESAAADGAGAGATKLFIRRPYPFRVVDVLLTNFHLPRSSLLVLIDAFVGPRWRDLYAEALAGPYRFLSFGDAMLLTRDPDGRPQVRPS